MSEKVKIEEQLKEVFDCPIKTVGNTIKATICQIENKHIKVLATLQKPLKIKRSGTSVTVLISV